MARLCLLLMALVCTVGLCTAKAHVHPKHVLVKAIRSGQEVRGGQEEVKLEQKVRLGRVKVMPGLEKVREGQKEVRVGQKEVKLEQEVIVGQEEVISSQEEVRRGQEDITGQDAGSKSKSKARSSEKYAKGNEEKGWSDQEEVRSGQEEVRSGQEEGWSDQEEVKSGQDEVKLEWGSIGETVRGVIPPALLAALSHTTPSHTYAHPPHQTFQDAPKMPQAPSRLRQDNRLFLLDMWGFYLPNIHNVSLACSLDLSAFKSELKSGKDWALKMVDSWGKWPDGVLAGNTWVLGLRDECVRVQVNQELPQAHFKGQYCVMSYGYKVQEEEGKRSPKKTMTPSVRMAAVAGSLGLAIDTNVYSTCIPSTCTQQELEWGVGGHLNEHLELFSVACQTIDPPTLEYIGRDVTMIVVLCVLGALVLTGTCADVWLLTHKRPHPKKGALRYVLVFSAYTNLEKMFRINTTEGPEVISCLHGIRVLSMSWVILGHAYYLSLYGCANKALLPDMIAEQLIPMQVILNSLPSVDTFFFISGLLVAYNLTKEFERTRSFNPVIFVVHRFLRLAPPILFLCGIFAVFPPLFIIGSQAPLLVRPNNMVDLCRRYWWRDSFFLTNWFFSEVDTESCLPVCWYTAVDFQLYLLTPFFLLPLLYRRKLGQWWMYCLLLISCLVPGIIIGALELAPTQVQDVSFSKFFLYLKWVYTKPWARASPFLVGIWLGYFMRVDLKQQKFTMKKWQAVIGWVLAIVTLSLVIFGIPQYNTFSGEPHPYDPAISISYGALHRLAWGVGIAWIVFACHYGYGGPINTFLSHPFWQPLSRLTYTTFLIALNIEIFFYIYIPQLSSYYSHLNRVIETVGIIFLSALCGVGVSLLSESPIIGLERLILRKPKTAAKSKAVEPNTAKPTPEEPKAAKPKPEEPKTAEPKPESARTENAQINDTEMAETHEADRTATASIETEVPKPERDETEAENERGKAEVHGAEGNTTETTEAENSSGEESETEKSEIEKAEAEVIKTEPV